MSIELTHKEFLVYEIANMPFWMNFIPSGLSSKIIAKWTFKKYKKYLEFKNECLKYEVEI
jgi:hypothetical protein